LARPPLGRAAALLLAVAAVGACGGTAKREARSLIAAVDRYRHAEAPAMASRADAVAAVACTDPAVCDAKRACLAAITPTTRAFALKDEVARGLGDIEQKRLSRDSPDARALPAKLDEAEALLREGRAKMTACEDKLAVLQVEHGV